MTSMEHGDALEDLIRRHGGRLLATARRILPGDEEAARDAVQDAFLSAHLSLPDFRGRAALSTWLHRIVINAALMRRRARQRRREAPIEDLLPTFDGAGRHQALGAEPPRPEGAVEAAALRRAVRACIDQLPDSYRTVLLLRDIEELTTEEAAAALDITPNAVKVRLHRARQALLTLISGATADAHAASPAAATAREMAAQF